METTTIEKTILRLLQSGEFLTVAMGNRIAHTTETRKIISKLRAKNIPIQDKWNGSGRKKWKVYFLSPEDRQTV